MTDKIKRAIVIILSVCIICTLFAGCGKKSTETNVATGSEVKLNGDKIYPIQCDDTLTYWFNATAMWITKYDNFAKTPIGKEIAEKTGVKVEYIHPNEGQGNEQFQILLASDDLPDMVNNTWYSFQGGPDEAIDQKYIHDLTDIIEKYCPAFSKILDGKETWVKDMKTEKGRYYTFPSFTNGNSVSYGPIVRKDLLEKYNLELPVTIDDWENMLTTFKNGGIESPYYYTTYGMTMTFYPAFGGFVDWYHDNGVVKFGAAQPQYKDFLVKMNDWYNKGLIYEDFAVVDFKSFDADVINGNVGSFIGYLGSGFGTFLDKSNLEGFDLAGAQFPVMKEGDVNAEYGRYFQEVGTGVTTAISTKCKNVELAARFLDFGFTEEGHNIYNFGVEGESYNWIDKDGEKYPEFTDLVYHNPEGASVSDVLHCYTRACHANVPMLIDDRFTFNYYNAPQQQSAVVEWSKSNMGNHALPPIYISPEEADVDADIMAAVNTYVDEMTIKFITGREPLAKIDEYFAQLKAFEIDKATAFRQNAYDRYTKR